MEYIDHTYQSIDKYAPEMREWIDMALQETPTSSVVFEVGSATLRDAKYMRRQGYAVICSDAAISFVLNMKENGENAQFFNVLTDKFADTYGMVFANGVFPHFTPDEMRHVLQNIHQSLSEDGILAFSIKYGVGEEWIEEKFQDKRFTHFWRLEELFDLLSDEGYEIIFHNNNTGSYPSHRWLNVVCRKMD
jgi:SAM-dependent methyltransferase